MYALLKTEVQRATSRVLVRLLVLMALVASAIGAVLSFRSTAAAAGVGEHAHGPLALVDLWDPAGSEGILLPIYFLLLLGAIIGAASVIGAEWRYGTIGSLLTFEPRRLRVGAAKLIATAGTAMAIALGLLVALFVVLLPTLVLHGVTDGADRSWWAAAFLGLGRALVLVGFGAALAGSIALLTRSTVAVIVVFFIYLQFLERLLIVWKPWLSDWALTENVGSFLTWGHLGEGERAPDPTMAGLKLACYLAVMVLAALSSFRRRDVAGAM